MASPGLSVAAPVFQQESLVPLIERVSRTLDWKETRERAEKQRLKEQFANEISSIDYVGLTTDQIDHLKKKANALVDLNATMIKNAGGDPRLIDQKTILREQNNIRALGDKWRRFDQEISTVNKALQMDEDNVYDKEAMQNALMSMTYETAPNGERMAREEVNTGEALAMLDNPAFMDPDAYIKREINKLDKQETSDIEVRQGVPGFGTLGLRTSQTTQIPWQIDPVTQTPRVNPDTGDKMLDLDTWSKMVVNDPNVRKHIQHFASKAGVTVNEWLYRKGLEHNATPKTIEQVLMPRAPRAETTARQSEDVKKVFLDTVSGLLNQSPELVSNLPEAAELDEDQIPYRDATKILQPYALTKEDGKASPFYKVYLSDGNPGSVFVKDTPNSNIRKLTDAEITNVINAAGTLNTALRGIDSYSLKHGYVTGQNVFNPNVNIMQDPLYLEQRGQMRNRISAERLETQQKLKGLATKVRNKNRVAFWGGDQINFSNEINAALEGKTINIPGKYGRKTTITDPTVDVDVTLWGPNTISIKDGDKTVATLTGPEFADLIESSDFIVGEGAIIRRKKPESESEAKLESEQSGEFDTLGL